MNDFRPPTEIALANGKVKESFPLPTNADESICSEAIQGEGQNGRKEDEDSDWQALLGLAEAQWQRGDKPEALSSYDCALQLVRRFV
jgi:hypothetical protein